METFFRNFVLTKNSKTINDHEVERGVTDGIETVSYVAGKDGRQELKSGEMWHPVNIVNRQAWNEIERQVKRTRDKIAAGKISCLHYYMVVNHMDTGLLAQYTGQSRLLVFLHTFPFIFKRLGSDTLQKYADVFKIMPEDLIQGKLLPPVYGKNHGEQHAEH